MSFTFQLEPMTVDQLASFTFELVTSAALLRYQAQVDIEKTCGIELDREGRRECVLAAFDEALDKLSPENPFREPIRRYLAEVALPFVDTEEPAPPTLKLVR